MDDLSYDLLDRLLSCVVLFLIWCLLVILSIEIEEVESKLEQMEQMQYEQVEESTVTCPRCFKQFDINDQAPDYKKPQRRPAPCGTTR